MSNLQLYPIPLDAIEKSGEVIQINHKIPARFSVVKSIITDVSIRPDNTKSLCDISISFNNGKDTCLAEDVAPMKANQGEINPCTHIELKQNHLVSGYVRDLKQGIYPYRPVITLLVK